jgi:hypothetical protein
MTIQHVSDLKTPIGEIIEAAGSDGLLLEAAERGHYALIPLDDDLIDFLIERSPAFLAACRAIRGRMDTGQSLTHEDVKRQLRPGAPG